MDLIHCLSLTFGYEQQLNANTMKVVKHNKTNLLPKKMKTSSIIAPTKIIY